MDGSLLSTANLQYIEELYETWKTDKDSVDASWAELFRDQESARRLVESVSTAGGDGLVSSDLVYKQSRVDSLVWGYRDVGYLYARLNPLSPAEGEQRNYYAQPAHTYEQLTLEEYGLSESDLETEFSAGRALQPSRMKLSEIVKALRETYCSTVGVEFLHIQNKPIRRWLIQRMEAVRNQPSFDAQKKKGILEDLIRAEEFEHFMHTAFIGQKRFSLEGAEVVIPALHHVVESAHELGIRQIVMGMSHRGRLTVLNRILNKPLAELFNEFEGHETPGDYGGSGDVKYHLGYITDHVRPDGSRVRVNLVANPSHLESVDPIVEGMARALQKVKGDTERKRIVPILLHGDAAFSGQGVVAETFNLSTLSGYKTGGTIHVIINNQIGFTTSMRDARSTFFPTDVAKMLPVPILHVNGDDPEAVVYTMDLALRYRQTFGRDVVVDIFCYRKYGHNEGDDPSFTHPLMYKIIEKKKSQAMLYAERCREAGIASKEDEEKLRREWRSSLRSALEASRAVQAPASAGGAAQAAGASNGNRPESSNAYRWEEKIPGPSEETLGTIAEKITSPPPGFHIHAKLKRILDEKTARLARDGTLDWAFAEALAFGSLALEGIPVRLSGQDSARGTFSQRHLIWWDTETSLPSAYTPLANLAPGQSQFLVYDSPLTEYSILGFEYGYSLGMPDALAMWEAQFGDFANGAQVIIDNYVAAGEAKWGTVSGVVLLLPHGYEGQGPEHSSAHLERYLMQCADDNMQVVNCSTPAQYFHLLRRQVKRSFRKPLIVMTPKSLLRHPMAVSTLKELSEGSFSEVLDDPRRPENPRRLLFCSGKIYYDLAARRDEIKGGETAIVRLEQLYPFPRDDLARILDSCRGVESVAWVQEEPRNRGAWVFVKDRFQRFFEGIQLQYTGREESASPATGSHSRHQREQAEILASALPEARPAKETAVEEPAARGRRRHSVA